HRKAAARRLEGGWPGHRATLVRNTDFVDFVRAPVRQASIVGRRRNAMTYQTIEVRKLTPHIGAEIFGADLSRPLGNQQFQEVHDALMDRLVIFFRDQKISIEQHKDFGRRFGKLHMHPASPDIVPEHPEVLIIKADDKAKYIPGEDWHSDVS